LIRLKNLLSIKLKKISRELILPRSKKSERNEYYLEYIKQLNRDKYEEDEINKALKMFKVIFENFLSEDHSLKENIFPDNKEFGEPSLNLLVNLDLLIHDPSNKQYTINFNNDYVVKLIDNQ
jgi:uncharacterized membrane protein